MAVIKIFNSNIGGASISNIGKGRAFITFSGGAGGDALGAVVAASAPVTGVTVTQKVDYAITKALSKDFLVSTFGDSPVSITISGIELLNLECTTTNKYSSIVDFYDKNKLSTNIMTRLNVGISVGADAVSYTCVLLGLTLQADTRNDMGNSTSSYVLDMLGVKL